MKRYIPAVAFLVSALVALMLPVAAYRAASQASMLRFEKIADEAIGRVMNRVGRHISLLVATRAFMEAQPAGVTRNEFSAVIRSLKVESEFSGMQGIGYVKIVAAGGETGVEKQILRSYGIERAIFPATGEAVRGVVAMLEPQDELNRRALGYDMYSDGPRRDAMLAAARSGGPKATTKVELVQETGPIRQASFLVYVPVYSNSGLAEARLPGVERAIAGFVYAPFRAGDLLTAVLELHPKLPVHVEAFAGTPEAANLMFTSPTGKGDFGEGYRFVREADIAGQKWSFVITPANTFDEGPERMFALVLGAISILMALAIGASMRSQMKALAASRKAVAVTRNAAREQNLLLQEMQHRIKNSIARVLAIARQTAANSESIEEFTKSFTNRLQSMAASQDMISRSKIGTAMLEELLRRELSQVLGDGLADHVLCGPPVELGSRAAQALGLVFHELATNALKYTDMTRSGNSIAIIWRTGIASGGPLVVDWREEVHNPANPPEESGFGSRLIDSLIAGELGGSIERDFTLTGLQVRICVPLASLSA